MDELVQALKEAREDEAKCAVNVAELQAELEASPLWMTLQASKEILATARATTEEADAAVRQAALAKYTADGDKSPHPSVAIKLYQVVRYDASLALEYARQHLPQALRLDRITFEKAAKAIEIPGVEVLEEPRVTIAKML